MRLPILTTLIAISCWACGSPSEPETQGAQSPGSSEIESQASEAGSVKTGEPQFMAQEGWTEQAPKSAMRFKEYVLEGEGSPVLVVSHWPRGVGGLEANLERWETSVQGSKPCQVVTTQPNGLRIDLVHGEGAVSDGMGGEPSEGGLMAAYIEATNGRFEGVYTVKVVGPAATLAEHRQRLDEFLANL